MSQKNTKQKKFLLCETSETGISLRNPSKTIRDLQIQIIDLIPPKTFDMSSPMTTLHLLIEKTFQK